MASLRRILVTGLVFCACCFGREAMAIRDQDNQGAYTKPTEHNLPDKEVPGFFVNLGPTGARGVLTPRSFIVKYVFQGSPAAGRLAIGDEIVGAFDKPFSEHHFGGDPHGYEGPIMDLGLAIEKAEGTDGKLVLNVKSGESIKKVTIGLEAIGTFGPTFPYKCKKSELVRARALTYLAESPDAWGVWQAHARSAVALALLSSDVPKQQAAGREMVLAWAKQPPDDGTWTWSLSYQLITLCEYYLLTSDASVLPTIKADVLRLEHAQYSGKIVCWQPKPEEDASAVLAAQQLYDGGFGHGPYIAAIDKNGYGPMQYTTILAVTAWQLAGRCGVDAKPGCIRRSLDFIHRGTNEAGYIAYGGEFTLNNGIVDSVAWRSSRDGDNYVGRTGAAIVAHTLSPEFEDSGPYLQKYRAYARHAVKSMPDGHADSNLGIFWGVMGAAASEDLGVLRATFDYHKAFFNMMRCFDGSFVLLPGRDYADNGYYMASRYHPTATMALAYGLSHPKFLIQGIQASIPGVNPKALSGQLALAYKAIVAGAFGSAAKILTTVVSSKKATPEDLAAAEAMMAFVRARFEKEVAAMEAIEKRKDIHGLSTAFLALKKTYSALDDFKEKTKRFEDGLKSPEWKAAIKLGGRYTQMMATLKRSRSQTALQGLERFATENPDSLYGEWAASVVKEFREKGEIVDPSAESQPTKSPPTAPEGFGGFP
jgi:hypothetical protein